METYGWLEGVTLQDELSCVIMVHGEQYVMTCGTVLMLEWSVDNLDCQPHVSTCTAMNAYCSTVYSYTMYLHSMEHKDYLFCSTYAIIIIPYSEHLATVHIYSAYKITLSIYYLRYICSCHCISKCKVWSRNGTDIPR